MARRQTQDPTAEIKPRRHGPRYRKVEVAVWGDGRFAALSAAPPNAQTLWLYLLCGWRTTIFPGLVVARPAVLASDLKWPLEGLREALFEVRDQNLIESDEEAGVILLKRALFHGPGRTREDVRETARPESPNVLISWSKSWFEIPDCQLKTEYLHELGAFAEALGGGFPKAYRASFRKALAKASSKGTHHPIDNQDQDSGTGSETGEREESLPLSDFKRVTDENVAAAIDAKARRVLNRLTDYNGVAYKSPEHLELVKARLREGITEYELRAVVVYCAENLKFTDDKMRGHLNPHTLFSADKLVKYLDAARSTYADEIARAGAA